MAETNGREVIEAGDVEEISALFYEGKRSAKILHEQRESYIS